MERVFLLILLLLLTSCSSVSVLTTKKSAFTNDSIRAPASELSCSKMLSNLINTAGLDKSLITKAKNNVHPTKARFNLGHLSESLFKESKFANRFKSLQDSIKSNLSQEIYLKSSDRSADIMSKISRLPIEDVVIAPGHQVLRSPKNIDSLVKYIQDGSADFSHDKLILNLITDESGRLQFVDAWNGHHRLVAYLKADYKSIDSIGENNIRFLINGVEPGSNEIQHYIPAYGIDQNALSHFTPVPGESFGTISVSGKLSNYELGSRSTVGTLAANIGTTQPRIGVFFGSFDPLHEGHVQTAKNALKEFGMDEIIFIPNIDPLHKPNITASPHRLNMMKARLKDEDHLNLLTHDTTQEIKDFTNQLTMQKVAQIYGTANVFQIQGGDAFLKLESMGQVNVNQFGGYIVFPRDISEAKALTDVDSLNGKVLISKKLDFGQGLSSTKVKKMLKENDEDVKSSLAPEIINYIFENGLYETKEMRLSENDINQALELPVREVYQKGLQKIASVEINSGKKILVSIGNVKTNSGLAKEYASSVVSEAMGFNFIPPSRVSARGHFQGLYLTNTKPVENLSPELQSDLRIFNILMSNPVADKTNLKVVKHWKTGEDQLVVNSIDSAFSDSYVALDYFPGEFAAKVDKISRDTFSRLKSLKRDQLKSLFEIFDEGTVEGILSRRDGVLRHFEGRLAQGENIFFDK